MSISKYSLSPGLLFCALLSVTGCGPASLALPSSSSDGANLGMHVDGDGDGFTLRTDCDDADASTYPGAPDAWYDGMDSDCAGNDDHDADGDGYDGEFDCDDGDAATYPGAADTEDDGVDHDCASGDPDADADGYASIFACARGLDACELGPDCDDADASVYPGATDAWYDGIDSDCAGNDDYDADGDGYALPVVCHGTLGFDACLGGPDCDDTDASVSPGAEDVWYDGVDTDCQENDDFDADGDGYPVSDDCDDTVPSVHPGAEILCGDGVDQDCDGSDTACPGGEDTGGSDTGSDTGGSDTGSDTGGSDTGSDTGVANECLVGTAPATGPQLLTAADYAVLAGSTVTSTGATVLTGDLGVSPGSAIIGFPPGIVTGATHTSDASAGQAQSDLGAAYVDAASRSGATPLPADISGMTLVPGVYSVSASLQIASADLVLDGGGDPNATWIFQIGSTLVTSSGFDVTMAGCGDVRNVYWVVGSSATLGTGTDMVGTVMADQSITAETGVTVEGRLLARVGAVTLDSNEVSAP